MVWVCLILLWAFLVLGVFVVWLPRWSFSWQSLSVVCRRFFAALEEALIVEYGPGFLFWGGPFPRFAASRAVGV